MTTETHSKSGSDAKEKTGDEAGAGDFLAEFFGAPIHAYTRAQFIADGGLVIAPAFVSHRFFTISVGVTRSVWNACVSAVAFDHSGDATSRLDALLEAALFACRKAGNSNRADFLFEYVPVGAYGTTTQRDQLVLHIGGGDDGEAVITLMRPSEA